MRANGFEAAWAGDYTAFPDGTGLKVVIGPAPRSGDFAAELPSTGFARYVTTSLPQPSQTFTDGIWACFDSTVMGEPQRIRHWFGNVPDVVGLWLLPDTRLELRVLGVPVGASERHAVERLPDLHAARSAVPELHDRRGGRLAAHERRRSRSASTHFALASVRETNIGNDSGVNMATLRWDDHTFSPGIVLPGDLGIVGFAPAADGFYGSGWARQNCPPGPLFPCVGARPPNISTVISDEYSERARVVLSRRGAARRRRADRRREDAGRAARDTEPVQRCGGLFLRTGGCDEPERQRSAGGAVRPGRPAFVGVTRLDEINPATGVPWSRSDIAGTEFGIRHPNDDQDLYVTQVVVEVIYDRDPPTPSPTNTRTLTATPTRTADADR